MPVREDEQAGQDRGEERVRLLPRLLRGTPEEILSRLSNCDPLRLEERSARRLKQGFFLMDPDRVFERSLARLAILGPKVSPEVLDAAWLDEQLDHVIASEMEEGEEERRSPFDCDPEDLRYRFLRRLFIAAKYARTASWTFNRLPIRARMAFHFFALDKLDVRECLAMGIWTKDDLYEDIWRALAALGYHNGEGRPDPEWRIGEHAHERHD